MYKKCFKRVIDFTLSLIALIMLSPVLLILILYGRFLGASSLDELPELVHI